MTLVEMVRAFGVGQKLKAAVMRERGWRPDPRGADHDDWYRNWPTFSRELTAAITEAHP